MDVQLVRQCWYVLSMLRSCNRPGQRQNCRLDLLLAMDGFFGLELEALRKACTGTLFGAGDVFAATDALQLATRH